MKALRTKSRCISDNKIGSARPNSTSLIGSWGQNFIQKMKLNSIAYKPKVTGVKVPIQQRRTVSQAYKIFTDAEEDEQKAWGVCPVLNDRIMKTYIKNPLNEKAFDETSKLLSVRAEPI